MFILAAAMIVAGVALFVAAPLGIGLVGARAKSAGELQTERHEHERALAVQGFANWSSIARWASCPTPTTTRCTRRSRIERSRRWRRSSASAMTKARKKGSVTALNAPRPAPPPRRIDPVPTLVVHREPPRPPQPLSQQHAVAVARRTNQLLSRMWESRGRATRSSARNAVSRSGRSAARPPGPNDVGAGRRDSQPRQDLRSRARAARRGFADAGRARARSSSAATAPANPRCCGSWPGLEAPSGGRALVFGQDTRQLAARYRRRIGMMAHQSFLYPNLTARENLEFYAELYSLADPRASADSMAWTGRAGRGCRYSRAHVLARDGAAAVGRARDARRACAAAAGRAVRVARP